MKVYANVDLYQIDADQINTQYVQHIRDQFYKANGYISNYHALSSRSDKVITHIGNYTKLGLIEARTSSQALAFAIKFMPDKCALAEDSPSYVRVTYVKQVLKDAAYSKMDLPTRVNLIEALKPLLNINTRNRNLDPDGFSGAMHKQIIEDRNLSLKLKNKNWDLNSAEFCGAIRQQNLAVAYGYLKQIEAMDKKLPKNASNKHLSYIMSMQLLNYLDVIVYMRNTIIKGLIPFATSEIITLYECVNNALSETLNKFIALPEVETRKFNIACLEGMFFSCVHKSALTVGITEKELQIKSKIFSYNN